MSQSFVTQIEQVRRRLVRRRLLVGVCWVFAATAVTALGLMAVDRAMGVDERGIRLLASALLAATGIWAVRRWLAGPNRLPVTRLGVALEIEHRHPWLRDMVASGVEFFEQPTGDPLAGSETLRRTVVLRADQAVEDLDWDQLVPSRPLLAAGGAAIGVAVLLGLLGWITPQTLGIGFTRLLNPLTQVDWPRKHDLVFVDPPTLLAAGNPFEVRLRDRRGTLPETVEIHYRPLSLEKGFSEKEGRLGNRTIETEPMIRRGERMFAHRSAGQTSFEFRATGGDHRSMPWHRVEVLPRPRIESLEITAHPPPYTGKSAEIIGPPYRVLAGTSLELVGKVNKPLSGVRILGQSGLAMDANLGPDGETFHVLPTAWKPAASGQFWLELTTPEGLVVRAFDPISLDVVPDRPPRVAFLQPTKNLSVVASARIDFVIDVTDDLGIRDASLVCRHVDRAVKNSLADEEIILLEQGTGLPSPASRSLALRRKITHTLDLTDRGLKLGQTLAIVARASDHYPNTGQTARELRLSIISHDELLRRLEAQQSRILDLLGSALAQQRSVRSRVAAWHSDSNEFTAQRIRSEGQPVLYSQRKIADMLTSLSGQASGRTVVGQIDGFLQTMRTNRQSSSSAVYDLAITIRERLIRLTSRDLPQIEQQLSDVVKRAEREASSDQQPPLRPPLAELQRRQDEVIGVLEQTLAALARWNSVERIAHELTHLRNDQRRLLAICQREIAPHVWNEEKKPAEGAVRRVWQDAAHKQQNLSPRFANLVMSMEAAAQHLAVEDPPTASRLSQQAAQAKKLRIQATLQAAADHLSEKRLGLTMSFQRQALKQLERLTQPNVPQGTEPQMLPATTAKLKSQQQMQANHRKRQPDQSAQAGKSPAASAPKTTTTGVPNRLLLDSMNQLVEDLWGQLPERDRKRIMQPLSEDFLPQYAPEIEHYFRALAEPEGIQTSGEQ